MILEASGGAGEGSRPEEDRTWPDMVKRQVPAGSRQGPSCHCQGKDGQSFRRLALALRASLFGRSPCISSARDSPLVHPGQGSSWEAWGGLWGWGPYCCRVPWCLRAPPVPSPCLCPRCLPRVPYLSGSLLLLQSCPSRALHLQGSFPRQLQLSQLFILQSFFSGHQGPEYRDE